MIPGAVSFVQVQQSKYVAVCQYVFKFIFWSEVPM